MSKKLAEVVDALPQERCQRQVHSKLLIPRTAPPRPPQASSLTALHIAGEPSARAKWGEAWAGEAQTLRWEVEGR